MKTGIFSLPDAEMTFHAAVDYAKELGIHAIEPYPAHEFALPDREQAKRLAEYAASQNIEICCFSMAIDIVSGDRRAAIERLKRYAEVASALGSPYLHHTLYPSLSFEGNGLSFKEALRYAVEGVREVYDYAAQLGVQCVYEDQGFYFNGVQRFDDFLGEAGRDVGVVADLGNILFVGEQPEAFVARFASRIKHVHVKDYLYKDSRSPAPGEGWYASRDGGHLRGTIVGHGQVNFQRVFSILNAVGYEGFYSMEYDGLEDARLAHRMGLANMKRYDAMARMDVARYTDVHL